jgi:deoxyribodipyrimidine photo-lyase
MKDRVRQLNSALFRPNAEFVLYWSQMNRRVDGNHALAYAVDLANQHSLPVLVYEGLTCSYPYANDRLHTFILEGVPDTEKRLNELGIGYVFHLRRRRADPDNALYQLASQAGCIVTDDYPTFIARHHNARVPAKLDVPYWVVDSSCIVPMSRFVKREYAAYTIRPKITKLLPEYLASSPELRPRVKFAAPRPAPHTAVTTDNIRDLLASCEIDHSIPPSLSFRGGTGQAAKHLDHFLRRNLRRYAEGRNEPSEHATSDLSPYLHFGHISALEVTLAAKEYARAHKLNAAEFLEELIVRRELAFNFARHAETLDSLNTLPDWAQKTLALHSQDEREWVYNRDQFERAETHDVLWNAAQKEMLLRGKIHGYYRMYWGKKIIEWSATHEDALATMLYLHDRYALDGRDPNTYTNVLWCFGLHDRPWFERPVFGQIRYMSYGGMKRKTNVDAYVREIGHLERTGKDPFRL